LREADVDILLTLGQSLAVAGLGYAAWLSFLHAGKYDAESLRADIEASRAACTRGQVETRHEYHRVDQVSRISQSPVTSL